MTSHHNTTPPDCLCSAELPIIKSSLSVITDKLAVLTGLVLNLQPTRQVTAQDDLTYQNAAYEDLTVTASKLVLAKHQHSKPSGKEFG